MTEACTQARRFLADPKSVPPEVARPSVQIAAARGVLAFETLRGLARAADPAVRLAALAGLSALRGEARGHVLDAVLTGEVRAQDFRAVFLPHLDLEDVRRVSFDWLARHFDAVRATQPEFTFIHLPAVIGYARSHEELGRVRAVFEAAKVPGAERAIRQGTERCQHALALAAWGREDLEAVLGSRR